MVMILGSSAPRIAATAFAARSADIIGDVEVGESLHASHYVQYTERYLSEMSIIPDDDDEIPF
jgi:carbonic anhydrase/acetyltransferase-like protein (isoleucine patch superfamily)